MGAVDRAFILAQVFTRLYRTILSSLDIS